MSITDAIGRIAAGAAPIDLAIERGGQARLTAVVADGEPSA